MGAAPRGRHGTVSADAGFAAGDSTSSPAARALNAGQYDEVEHLLKGATDPTSVALRARAQIAQGKYQEAQALLTPVASAQPDSDAALELGLLELYLGRRADGIRRLRTLAGRLDPRTARDYFRLARAATALANFADAQAFKEANSFFRDANRLAPDDADINAAWGELFLDKHNPADAMKSFQEAIRVDGDHVGALIGAARANAGTNPPVARTALERALKVNPNSVPAHLLQAELALDDRERDNATSEHHEGVVDQSEQPRSPGTGGGASRAWRIERLNSIA